MPIADGVQVLAREVGGGAKDPGVRHGSMVPCHAAMLPAVSQTSLARAGRVTWTVATIFVVECLVFGLSGLPAFLFWTWALSWATPPWPLVRPLVLAISLVPAYLVFATTLIVLSAGSTRLFGWRTAPGGAWRLTDLEWGLLNWSRYMISTHVVRVLVGTFFRSSPLWTWYMKLNGARIGRGVYINSLSISDHNMLEFGDGVVIGESVHLSGHTVEGGLVKTGYVRLGKGVTVGLGSMVGIGVEAGERCQIGALSVVPKNTKLEAGRIYAGVPARRIEKASPSPVEVG
jgi:acetyltransferase-like isoleucine patch superfamily enzyme